MKWLAISETGCSDYLRLIRKQLTQGIALKFKAPDHSPASAAQIALAVYQPQPYLRQVVLFQASQREWFMDTDPMEAWKELIRGDLVIRTVTGAHLNLMKDPCVG